MLKITTQSTVTPVLQKTVFLDHQQLIGIEIEWDNNSNEQICINHIGWLCVQYEQSAQTGNLYITF